jgi:hypothetical protein
MVREQARPRESREARFFTAMERKMRIFTGSPDSIKHRGHPEVWVKRNGLWVLDRYEYDV